MKKMLLQILIIIVSGAGIYYCITQLFTGYDSELGGDYQIKVVALEANNEQTATLSFRLASQAKSKPGFQLQTLDPAVTTPEMQELAPYWIEITIPNAKLKPAPALDFASGPIVAPSEKEKVGILTHMILAEANEQTVQFYAGFSLPVELTKSEAAKTNLTFFFSQTAAEAD